MYFHLDIFPKAKTFAIFLVKTYFFNSLFLSSLVLEILMFSQMSLFLQLDLGEACILLFSSPKMYLI